MSQRTYAATAARPYPITLFKSIFSRTNVDANAESTRKDVETGIPFRVNNTSANGAIA